MATDTLYRTESAKPLSAFVRDLGMTARKYGFVIHNEDKMDMGSTFRKHGTEVAAGFDLHMIAALQAGKSSQKPRRQSRAGHSDAQVHHGVYPE